MPTIETNGILFDLDGTLVETTVPVENYWRDFASENALDYDKIISQSHGRRTIDTLKIFKPELATDEQSRILEKSIPERWGHLASTIKNASEFLNTLPVGAWGVVTSGTYGLASGWFNKVLKRPFPPVFITADDVSNGKPDPSGYLKGKELLGLAADESFIVFEDTIAGVSAAKQAGAKYVIGLATTYSREKVASFGADFVIDNYSDISLVSYDHTTKTLTLEINSKIA